MNQDGTALIDIDTSDLIDKFQIALLHRNTPIKI